MSRPSLDFCLALTGAHARLQLALDEELGQHLGLAYADFRLLTLLARAAGQRLPLAELARLAGLTRSALLRQVLPLEKTGLLERSGATVALRPAGAATAQTAAETANAVCADTVQAMDTEALASAGLLLGRLAAPQPA